MFLLKNKVELYVVSKHLIFGDTHVQTLNSYKHNAERILFVVSKLFVLYLIVIW
jgi:hypothetical protein